jgi:hypothetical protein
VPPQKSEFIFEDEVYFGCVKWQPLKADLVGDPVQGEHASVGETLGQNLKTAPVIGMRMRENDPIDGLAERLHV